MGKKVTDNRNALRVAVIGGGTFGTSIAAEIGKDHEVILFEKNSELLQEGTFVNCFRHHRGYHYPRSNETVLEVQQATVAFEELYLESIVDNYKTYYALVNEGSYTTQADYLKFCDKHGLPYKIVDVPKDTFDSQKMALCIEVEEPSYHYETLKALIEKRLTSSKNIEVLLNAKVIDMVITSDGKKRLTFEKNSNQKVDEFDVVINATYANINQFSAPLNFPLHPVRIDLVEEIIVQAERPPVSLTVIDGPFTTVITTGNPNEFVAVHAKVSIFDRYVSEDGLPRKTGKILSRAKETLAACAQDVPFLNKAKITSTRIVHRAVRANREDDDTRASDVISHGHNCYSVLSGKIITCVSIGRHFRKVVNDFYDQQTASTK